jgi:hypothetical protein
MTKCYVETTSAVIYEAIGIVEIIRDSETGSIKEKEYLFVSDIDPYVCDVLNINRATVTYNNLHSSNNLFLQYQYIILTHIDKTQKDDFRESKVPIKLSTGMVRSFWVES